MFSQHNSHAESSQNQCLTDAGFKPKILLPTPSGEIFTSKIPKVGGNRTGKKNFPKWKKEILLAWMEEHKENPYPSESQKRLLTQKCDMTKKQLCNWFTNARKR